MDQYHKKAKQAGAQAFDCLRRNVGACVDAGLLRRNDVEEVAQSLWAAMHGVVSLELKGYYLKSERADQLFDAAVNAVLLSLKTANP